MNFPKFWSRGEAKGFQAWGWSNESIAQAKALGIEAPFNTVISALVRAKERKLGVRV